MSSRARSSIVLAALLLSTFAYVTTETLPIGLLGLIAHDLGVTGSAVGLLVGGYALVVVVATVPLTRATARVPRRLLLSVLLAVFVVATLLSALSTAYWMLLVARLLTALTQAVFWAVVLATAAGLVAPERRGRAVSVVYAGGSLATVVGVPIGTWLGQAVDLRAAFVAMSVIGALVLALVAALLPTSSAAEAAAEHGSRPDARRFRLLVAVTALTVTASFTAFTYVTPFLTEVSGFPPAALGGLLLVRGVAGFLAVLAVGQAMDRAPRRTLAVVVGGLALALALQSASATVPAVAAVAVTLSGAAIAGFSAALGARVLEVAPGRVDSASATTSTAYNVGIMSGSLLGGALLPLLGPAGLPVVAAVIGLAAVGVLLAERRDPARAARPAHQSCSPAS